MSQYIGKMTGIALLLFPFYLLLRVLLIRGRRIERNIPREILLGLFVVSMGALAALALQPAGEGSYWPGDMLRMAQRRMETGDQVNFVPFRMMRTFSLSRLEPFLINIVGNVVMFIPIGLCLPLLYKWWQPAWKIAVIGLLAPLFIETVQFFIGRWTDIDDILLNFTGVMAGYGVFLLIKKFTPKWALFR